MRPVRRRSAFVLLEVLVSLTILGIALAMVLKQMTTSIKAVRRTERLTVASMLARRLVEEWELTPPPQGVFEGSFAPDYPEYVYRGEYRLEEVDYEDVPTLDEIGRLVLMRSYDVAIYFRPADDPNARDIQLLAFPGGLTSSERFTEEARTINEIGFDE